MLIVQVKDGESIDKALKRYKKKFEKAQILKILREKQFFEKKSVKRRQQIFACYSSREIKTTRILIFFNSFEKVFQSFILKHFFYD